MSEDGRAIAKAATSKNPIKNLTSSMHVVPVMHSAAEVHNSFNYVLEGISAGENMQLGTFIM